MRENSSKMADVEELKQMVIEMAKENAKLIAALAANPAQQQPIPVQQPDAAAIRAENSQNSL